MYAILSGGSLVALCDQPRYVKKNPDSGVYVQADKDEAEALAVSGVLYNLPGGTAVPDAPEAVVKETDGAEYVFGHTLSIQESKDTEALTLELSADHEARICAIELGV